MSKRIIRGAVAAIAAAGLLAGAPAGAQGRRPNQRGAGGPNATAGARPPAPVLYLSPSAVREVQRALQAAGEKPGRVDGVWNDASTKALASYQEKKGIDPSGHIDVMTIGALGLNGLLNGGLPASSASQLLSAEAMKTPGVELYLSPAVVRDVQIALEKKGDIPGNILGVWREGGTQAVTKFEKANGLDATGLVSLQLLHALDLDQKLATPAAPARVPMLTDSQAPYGGSPIYLTPASIRAVQAALNAKGMKDLTADGHWNTQTIDAIRKFQEAQHLSPTGTLNLRTLRALGFEQPMQNLAQPPAAKA